MLKIGTTTRRRRLRRESAFDCPHCKAMRPYRRKCVSRYVTLWYIPIFRDGAEDPTPNIECEGCRREFHEDILRSDLVVQAAESLLDPYENQQVAYDATEDLSTTAPCPHCGRENSARARVCPRCETRLT
ncbi:MAG: zinc-ribbon domain-containing protein [Planctomycetes bacterium]|nr:zinc-ribbon domain-containing protein [Planctomycetota bacterium]